MTQDMPYDETAPAAAEALRPDGLPDKFWDAEAGRPRLDALMKSYVELERRLGRAGTLPEAPDGYALTMPMDAMQSDPALNARLHKAGFTQEQVQMVYDLAAEQLAPYVGQMKRRMTDDAVHRQLAEHFGGDGAWGTVSGQLATWGKANLPPAVYDALSESVEGVQAMHRMMTGGEPVLGRASGRVNPTADETSLRQLMRDPRYWREQDPSIVARVREGFARLYPD